MRSRQNMLLGLGACCLGLVACGGESSVESTFGEGGDGGTVMTSGADSLTSILALASTAPWNTRYAGTRTVESHVEVDGNKVDLVYRESVFADGEGNFCIEPLEILSWVPEPVALESILKLREGFLYRYRDFHVRDLGSLFSNYIGIDMDYELEIAGRTCAVMQIQRPEEHSPTFFVAFDVETGLSLRFEERDSQGNLVTVMEFETYDADPNLDDVVWFASSNQESALDIGQELGSQVSFDTFEPKVLPDGYTLWKAATLIDPNGQTWLKQTYTDGVEPLFFLHGDDDFLEVQGHTGPASTTHALDVSKTDLVRVYRMGAVNVVQGVIHGRDVMVLGKVDAEDLLDLLQSAID